MQSTAVKNGFVRKATFRLVAASGSARQLEPLQVYSILTVQLIVTTLIAAPMLS